MKKLYKITGMTCESCAGKIRTAISEIHGVNNVIVTLDPPQVEIDSHHEISLDEINKSLIKYGGKYKAEEITSAELLQGIQTPEIPKPTLKTYLPLILVFFYILLGVWILEINSGMIHWMNMMNNFMGGFFLVFSFFKMLDVQSFAFSYSSYDVIAKRWLGYGYIYPFIELALGILFLAHAFPIATNIATLIVMGVSSIGVMQSLLAKRKIKCACLGSVFNLPMTNVTLIEDLLMVVMSVIMIISYIR